MTYIRMTGGRDRGHVKDLPFPAAQEMLALGQALPVDFNEPDALGFRELLEGHQVLHGEVLPPLPGPGALRAIDKVLDLLDRPEAVPVPVKAAQSWPRKKAR